MIELDTKVRAHDCIEGDSDSQAALVLQHLLSLPNVTIEDRGMVEQALSTWNAGLDFADALHHASYGSCSQVASFDDGKFARRAKRLGFAPTVSVPT